MQASDFVEISLSSDLGKGSFWKFLIFSKFQLKRTVSTVRLAVFPGFEIVRRLHFSFIPWIPHELLTGAGHRIEPPTWSYAGWCCHTRVRFAFRLNASECLKKISFWLVKHFDSVHSSQLSQDVFRSLMHLAAQLRNYYSRWTFKEECPMLLRNLVRCC